MNSFGFPSIPKKVYQADVTKNCSMKDKKRMFLEDGFKQSRQTVEQILEKGEVYNGELRDKVFELMKDKLEVFESNDYKYDSHRLIDKTFELIMSDIPTEKHEGLDEKYISKKGERLSEETAEDVAWRENYLREADIYMSDKGDGMSEEEFQDTVLNFIRDETDLKQKVEDKDFLRTVYGISSSLEEKYDLTQEEKYFGMPEEEVEEIYRSL